jgi:hypothetical protein
MSPGREFHDGAVEAGERVASHVVQYSETKDN